MTDVAIAFGLLAVAAALLFGCLCILANHMFRQRGLPAEKETSDDL